MTETLKTKCNRFLKVTKKSREDVMGYKADGTRAEWSGASAGAQRSTHAYVPEEKQMYGNI